MKLFKCVLSVAVAGLLMFSVNALAAKFAGKPNPNDCPCMEAWDSALESASCQDMVEWGVFGSKRAPQSVLGAAMDVWWITANATEDTCDVFNASAGGVVVIWQCGWLQGTPYEYISTGAKVSLGCDTETNMFQAGITWDEYEACEFAIREARDYLETLPPCE